MPEYNLQKYNMIKPQNVSIHLPLLIERNLADPYNAKITFATKFEVLANFNKIDLKISKLHKIQ